MADHKTPASRRPRLVQREHVDPIRTEGGMERDQRERQGAEPPPSTKPAVKAETLVWRSDEDRLTPANPNPPTELPKRYLRQRPTQDDRPDRRHNPMLDGGDNGPMRVRRHTARPGGSDRPAPVRRTSTGEVDGNRPDANRSPRLERPRRESGPRPGGGPPSRFSSSPRRAAPPTVDKVWRDPERPDHRVDQVTNDASAQRRPRTSSPNRIDGERPRPTSTRSDGERPRPTSTRSDARPDSRRPTSPNRTDDPRSRRPADRSDAPRSARPATRPGPSRIESNRADSDRPRSSRPDDRTERRPSPQRPVAGGRPTGRPRPDDDRGARPGARPEQPTRTPNRASPSQLEPIDGPGRARELAARALGRIEQDGAFADAALDGVLRRAKLADERDRTLATELVYGVTRWQRYLDFLLKGIYHADYGMMDPTLRIILRIALYQMLYLDRIPVSAAVDEAVKAAKAHNGPGAGNLINAMLRALSRQRGNLPEPSHENPVERLGIRYSHPDWIVARWLERMGAEQTEALLKADNERPAITLRPNPLRTTAEQLSADWTAAGIPVTRSTFLPDLLKVPTLTAPIRASLEAGLCSVQDESAALACTLLGAEPGETVIDLCAAPGGKSTFLAETMNNEGEVVAVDLYPAKLTRLSESADRLGLSIVHPVEADGRTLEREPADRVLIDAPCSGLGVLAKRADLRWHRRPDDLPELIELQQALLSHGATLVKPGGVLVYSTCTVEPDENQSVIEAFLADHPDFALESAADRLPADVVDDAGYLRTLPSIHGTDGAFAARLRRRAD